MKSYKYILFCIAMAAASPMASAQTSDPAGNALVAGWITGGATTLGDTFVLTPHFADQSTDAIVNHWRTPKKGYVRILTEASNEVVDVRERMMHEQRRRIARLRDATFTRAAIGDRSASAERANLRDAKDIVDVENKIKEIRNMSDEDILKMAPEQAYDVRGYNYNNLDELRGFLSETPAAKVVILPRAGRIMARSLRNGVVAGALTFVISSALNPASAAETPTSGEIPFASTQSAD